MTKIHRTKLFLPVLFMALVLLLSCAGCQRNPGNDAQTETPEATEVPAAEESADAAPADAAPDKEPADDSRVGYTSAAVLGDGFIACGTGGRVDRISVDGAVTALETGVDVRLNSVFTAGETVLISGDEGILLRSDDAGQTFHKEDSGASGALNGAVIFQDTLYAAGEGGVVFRQGESGWEQLSMASDHDIIRLIAADRRIVAVTAETDVYCSEDGENWSSLNFNEDYGYPAYVFAGAAGAGEIFYVFGHQADDPGLPLIMFSETGRAWTQKELTKINDAPVIGEENIQIHDIAFNVDQIVGVLDDGRILSVTECEVCNEEMQLDEQKDLWATAVQEAGVLVCGEDFYSHVVDGKQIRQDKIKPDQALIDMERGALLIDVREDEELAEEGYIPGSIHIPLAEVAEKLPEVAPDHYTELIFYCKSGKRSQKATEQAVDMGYQKVYNLGGISDWPYEIVRDGDSAENP